MKRIQPGDIKRCANCVHFYQHYFMPKYQEGKLLPSDCGHCMHGKRKTTRPNRCCDSFEMREISERPGRDQTLQLRILMEIHTTEET